MRSLFSAVQRSKQYSKDQKPPRGMIIHVVAVGSVIGFGLLQGFIADKFGLKVAYLMFFPAIMISAWYGGWRAGVTATLLSVVTADFFFMEPIRQLLPIVPSQLLSNSIFMAEGLFISVLGEARLQSRHALLSERNSLEEHIVQRTQEMRAANQALAAQIAEREKAQIALSESESKFRSVVETANDAIVMTNSAGIIVFWNRGAQEMFGYSAAEVLHKPVFHIIPERLREAHNSAMKRLEEGAAPRLLGQPLELWGKHRDESEFPLELSLAGWRVGDQQFYSGIMRDLTQRKQAEEDRLHLVEEMATRAELEAAEQHYRLLAEAIPQIVWTALPDGTVDYFNQHWFDYTGLDAIQAPNDRWDSVLHPHDKERTLQVWTQATATGNNYDIEYRFRRHDGIYRWYLGRAVPLRDEAGRIYKWFGTCTDIDSQKRTQENSRFLAQAVGRLTASLDEAAIVQVLADLCVPTLGNWCLVDLVESPEAKPLTHLNELLAPPVVLKRVAVAGRRDDETDIDSCYQRIDSPVQQGPWHALLSARTEILRGAAIEPLLQEGAILAAWKTQILGLSQTEETAFAPTVICVPLIARGHALGVLTIICVQAMDTPEATSIGIIEDLARNAALMIDNARLLRETQEANRAKDEFLAVLSHELRTPITAVLGWVQLLKTQSLDDNTQQRALNTIERNTHAQVQLIEDLLDLSRIITGKLKLELQEINLEPIIEAALDAVRPAAQTKEIALFVQISPITGLVMGDSHRLQQILWNLLSNAVKFTPKGGRIEVSLRQFESYVEIVILDSGSGISAEFLPYVFDRFRQADSSSTRQHGGLGLGLSIVRHVTELHGGTVQVTSEGPGHGAAFKILLPVAPLSKELVTPAIDNPVKTVQTEHADSTLLLEGVRVLLVDDERDTREMLGAVLRRYGAQVQLCESAQEALTTLPNWKPRVLVSDIGMPGADGYDLIGQVRALSAEQGGTVPAMALTAYARASDKEHALKAGFNRHAVKPVDPKTFASLVAELAEEIK